MKNILFQTTYRQSKNFTERRNHLWDLTNQLSTEDVLSKPEFSNFKFAGTIVWADNTCGFIIDLIDYFKNKPYIVYIISIYGKVLKGGKSKNPLNLRTYSAGTEETWTNRGTCSETNYIWSQVFRSVLKEGDVIEIYAYCAPTIQFPYDSFDGKLETRLISSYEEEEKKLNAKLKKMNGKNLIGEGNLLALYKQ